ncbi:MAG TPA: carbamoyltransferase HypF, partial [Bacteroidales bacterium]
QAEVPVSFIASKFHQTVIEVISATAKQMREISNVNKVVLSGGTFQNRIILEKVEKRLQEDGFEVFTHSLIPSNDGGIALGQLAIAAKRRENGKIS